MKARAGVACASAVALVALGSGIAAATPLPKGFAVVPASVSPDGKLGVIAPDADHAVEGPSSHQNQLVELATGKVLATIEAPTAFEHQNHAELEPVWSTDGSLLVWYVDGKWGSFDLVVLCVDRNSGTVTGQTDIRELAVREVLAAVRRAHPAAAAAAAREGLQDGWWFRDGLAIDVRPVLAPPPPSPPSPSSPSRRTASPQLPLTYAITFTSNPKDLDSYPADAQLSGALTAVQARCPLRQLAFGKLAISSKR